jgi:glucan phosphoethanolaminetransferase (alkaline phosphatase superfamily)
MPLNQALDARFALFISSLMPMSVWVLTGHPIAHPWQVWGWSLLCGVLGATAPARFFKPLVLLQICALPLTLGWIGAIAVTGFGPSNAAFEAAQYGPLHEFKIALNLALNHWSFILAGIMCCCSLIATSYLTWRKAPPRSSKFDLIFLITLAPLAMINLDGLGYFQLTRIAGPEARLSTPWLYQIELGKSIIIKAADQAGRIPGNNPDIRDATSVEKTFTMQDSIAVFVVGDSTRADSFIQPDRGIWSKQLQQRINAGMGVRLSDACAGGSSTNDSVPRLFTASAIDDIKSINQSPTILAIAKAAGAKTAYISNHEMWILPEAGHDLTQRTTAIEKQAFDDVPVEVLGDFIKKSRAGPKAAILHLYGQHFLYEDRYPHEEFPAIPSGLSGDELTELHYARAVEYGNKVLLELATILDQSNTPSFAIFTSDHGENLPSDKTGKKYHALPSSGKFDTTVPALILWNKAFKDTGKPALLKTLQNQKGLIAHRDLAQAWLVLAGMNGSIAATDNPHTWGALNPGEKNRALACNTLHP